MWCGTAHCLHCVVYICFTYVVRHCPLSSLCSVHLFYICGVALPTVFTVYCTFVLHLWCGTARCLHCVLYICFTYVVRHCLHCVVYICFTSVVRHCPLSSLCIVHLFYICGAALPTVFTVYCTFVLHMWCGTAHCLHCVLYICFTSVVWHCPLSSLCIVHLFYICGAALPTVFTV